MKKLLSLCLALVFMCSAVFALAEEKTPEELCIEAEKCFQNGEYEIGIELFKASAERGCAEAQCNLGTAYFAGDGVTPDNAQAVKWLTLAAEQGYLAAQVKLGVWYYYVTNENAEAIKWYTLAAEQGDADSQFTLGNIYKNNNTTQDIAEAKKWWSLAAEQGHADAQCVLGLSFLTDAEPDYEEGVKWLTLAAEQEHAEAQYCLALCYLSGYGVAKDQVEADKWFARAKLNGVG